MLRRRISIAILALGGQGGGVLMDWIAAAAAAQGWRSQGTSVPGVAQRTGTTVYYLELFSGDGPEPILALTPVPGDVDIVIASELMEAGRAILRGFVTSDRTSLIASTHRIYAIAEKAAMGDGTAASDRILIAAGERARRLIAFDMEAASAQAGSVISSVMFGALAGSGELSLPREAFENAIRASGIAVQTNLQGFAAGWNAAQGKLPVPARAAAPPEPTTEHGRRLLKRIVAELPADARALARDGVKRLMDYQDARYAALYLDRLAMLPAPLVKGTARHLALWMSYEDTIRVADLKTRATRIERVRTEVRVGDGQVLAITEYMHPRLREVCETMPAALGRFILARPWAMHILEPLFRKGRHVRTTSLGWYVVLHALAGLRRWRRSTLRFHEENARIEAWLALVIRASRRDLAAAAELIACQRLIKGYGDTFERGLRSFEAIVEAYAEHPASADAAQIIRDLRVAALADETGEALTAAVSAARVASRS